MVVDSILPHAEFGPNHHRKDVPPFIIMNLLHSFSYFKIYLGNNPGKIGAPKPPKLPDKPVLPYMHYSRKVWDDVKQNHPELKTYEIARQIGKNWRDLPDRERKIYENEYQREKQEYYEKMNHYNRSAAYQQYLG